MDDHHREGVGVSAAVDCAGTDEALDTSLALVADRIKVLGNVPGQHMGSKIRYAARAGLADRAGLKGHQPGKLVLLPKNR